jgi:hypothetical protein
MVDLLYYGAPLIAIGGVVGLISNNTAEVLAAQSTFIVLQAIGYGIGALLRRRNGSVMPAHVQPDGDLVVTFCHGDDEDQEEIATTGKHALEIARRTLAKCDELYEGDLLSIWRRRPAAKPTIS